MNPYRPQELSKGDLDFFAERNPNEGCINFDIQAERGPRKNVAMNMKCKDILDLNLQLKQNHRLNGNSNVRTLSRRYSRYVSKIGVPIRVPLSLTDTVLCVELSYFYPQEHQYVFRLPIHLELSKDRPYTQIRVRLNEKCFTDREPVKVAVIRRDGTQQEHSLYLNEKNCIVLYGASVPQSFHKRHSRKYYLLISGSQIRGIYENREEAFENQISQGERVLVYSNGDVLEVK